MKQQITIVFFFLCSLLSVEAQEIDLTELKTPSSPAFTILGIQPTEIARPTSFSAFKANVFESLNGSEGISIPQNVAMEFTPYWLIPHPELTFQELVGNQDIGQNILQNSSISIATLDVTGETKSTIDGTRMGVGYRTFLFKGSPSKVNREKLAIALEEKRQIERILIGTILPVQTVLATNPNLANVEELKEKIRNEFDQYFGTQNIDKQEEKAVRELVESTLLPSLFDGLNGMESPEAFRAEVKENMKNSILSDNNGLEARLKEKAEAIEGLISVNKEDYSGFFLEFSSALVFDFPEQEFGDGKIPKWGIWATPSYRTHDDSFEFLGVVRYLTNETLPNITTKNVDLGAKIAFKKGKFSLSGEYINRFQNATSIQLLQDGSSNETDASVSDIKAVLNLEYKLGNNILLTYTFGQNFDKNTEIDGNVISTVGLSYELGGKKIIKDFSLR